MSRMIFVNLPVADLTAPQHFYEAVGFTNNLQFTADTAACTVLSESINVMLHTHASGANSRLAHPARNVKRSDACPVL
jgi:predicted lactoylglutathione lyase